MKLSHTGIGLALAAGLTFGLVPAAFAAGTAAGDTISNTATVNYKVGTVDQDPVDSNDTEFLVDRKINLTVAEVGGLPTEVVPAATGQILTFTVTNNSNDTLDFRLTAAEDATNDTTAFGDTDNFNVTSYVIRVENGLAAGYQSSGPNEDTLDYIDELAADDVATVYVIASIPSNRADGDVAGVTLTAIAAGDITTSGDGSITATPLALAADIAQNDGDADDSAFIDTVFGDDAGDTDAAEDGMHSDDDQYNVVTATVVVTKSSRVVEDPFNGTTNPKAIPGATIEYCLDIENTGSATAGSIVLTDAVPANTTFVDGSIKTNADVDPAPLAAATSCDIGSGEPEDNNATDGDESDPDGGSFAAGNVTITSPSITAGNRWKASFRVTVD